MNELSALQGESERRQTPKMTFVFSSLSYFEQRKNSKPFSDLLFFCYFYCLIIETFYLSYKVNSKAILNFSVAVTACNPPFAKQNCSPAWISCATPS